MTGLGYGFGMGNLGDDDQDDYFDDSSNQTSSEDEEIFNYNDDDDEDNFDFLNDLDDDDENEFGWNQNNTDNTRSDEESDKASNFKFPSWERDEKINLTDSEKIDSTVEIIREFLDMKLSIIAGEMKSFLMNEGPCRLFINFLSRVPLENIIQNQSQEKENEKDTQKVKGVEKQNNNEEENKENENKKIEEKETEKEKEKEQEQEKGKEQELEKEKESKEKKSSPFTLLENRTIDLKIADKINTLDEKTEKEKNELNLENKEELEKESISVKRSYKITVLLGKQSKQTYDFVRECFRPICSQLFTILNPNSKGNFFHFESIFETLLKLDPVKMYELILENSMEYFILLLHYTHNQCVSNCLINLLSYSEIRNEYQTDFYRLKVTLFKNISSNEEIHFVKGLFRQIMNSNDEIYITNISDCIILLFDTMCTVDFTDYLLQNTFDDPKFMSDIFSFTTSKSNYETAKYQKTEYLRIFTHILEKSQETLYDFSNIFVGPQVIENRLSFVFDQILDNLLPNISKIFESIEAEEKRFLTEQKELRKQKQNNKNKNNHKKILKKKRGKNKKKAKSNNILEQKLIIEKMLRKTKINSIKQNLQQKNNQKNQKNNNGHSNGQMHTTTRRLGYHQIMLIQMVSFLFDRTLKRTEFINDKKFEEEERRSEDSEFQSDLEFENSFLDEEKQQKDIETLFSQGSKEFWKILIQNEHALVCILEENKFVDRLIIEYNKLKKRNQKVSPTHSYFILLSNLLRLQVALLEPDFFLKKYLDGHKDWINFQEELLFQTEQILDIEGFVKPQYCSKNSDLEIDYTIEGLDLGSGYAQRLGFFEILEEVIEDSDGLLNDSFDSFDNKDFQERDNDEEIIEK
ncbi:hypothetical protein M0812_02651 [Anaeramoeba flamelloides]|uniref:Uncharacterized protein n=1 Tax=Anaeramoeba flamelloides TaxID=1746091 RepID=A0AAV7YQS2_9EUKA|nr:hypothetical protein M0812_02651 [Anaeramoeba flamelloides]